MRAFWLLAAAILGCGRDPGRAAYLRACAPCHGEAGDGNGPAAPGMRPPPRDFTAPRFKMKFAAVAGGKLPNDADIEHVVRYGLNGTAMRAWDVSGSELDAIIEYLKTLSPRWRAETAGAPVLPTPDPWEGREDDAVIAGRALYHGEAGCASCHPGYQVGAATLPAGLKDSEFKAFGTRVKTLPLDFRLQPMRAVHDDPADPRHALRDLWRTVALGVAGTAMPGFRLADDPEDRKVWALVHYLDWLRKS